MAARIIVRIEVTKNARDEMDRLADKLGMTHLSIHSRMVEWLSSQPDEVKGAVLGQPLPETPGKTSTLILKNMQQQ
jgi:hypothetical protein